MSVDAHPDTSTVGAPGVPGTALAPHARCAGRARGGAALGKVAGSDFEISQDRRSARYDLRNRGRKFARQVVRRGLRDDPHADPRADFAAHRATFCGAVARKDSRRIAFRTGDDGRGGIAGLQHCGTAACPVCAAKIGQARTEEVSRVLVAAREAGHQVAMVTMTVRHGRSDRLEDLWNAVGDGWRSITTAAAWTGESPEAYEQRVNEWRKRGRQHDADRAAGLTTKTGAQRAPRGWKNQQTPARRIGMRERYGVVGMVRATEVTRGQSGWHPHVHVLVVMEPRRDRQDVPSDFAAHHQAHALANGMFTLWEKGLERHGFEAWRDSGGLHVDLMEATAQSIAGYVTKLAALSGLTETEALHEVRGGLAKSVQAQALETTRGDLKKSRGEKGETPFAILARACDGEVDAVMAWLEYLDASQGRRLLLIGTELRELAKLEDERTEEEIVNEDEGGEEVLYVAVTDWRERRGWLYAAELLTALENEGLPGLLSGLDMLDIPWMLPEVTQDGPHEPPCAEPR